MKNINTRVLPMNITFTGIISWIIALWAAKVFLFSLPYKFSGHPDTQHIFGTIGEWLKVACLAPLLASANVNGNVALFNAKVDVRGTAPGILATQ